MHLEIKTSGKSNKVHTSIGNSNQNIKENQVLWNNIFVQCEDMSLIDLIKS